MDKSPLKRKLVKLLIVGGIIIALYIIGCNSAKGESIYDITPLPDYTSNPSSPTTECPTYGPPILYSPPYNTTIQMRHYACWRNASGTLIYYNGKVSSTPPYYTNYNYTDGDTSSISLSIDKTSSSCTYNGSYVFDFIINMNKNPVTDTTLYDSYNISFSFGSFSLADTSHPDYGVDYSVSLVVKVSGFDSTSSYVSKTYNTTVDSSKFKFSPSITLEIDGVSDFYSINRLDVQVVIEADSPIEYANLTESTPQWYITAKNVVFTDHLQNGIQNQISNIFIPNAQNLQSFIQSKLDTTVPIYFKNVLQTIIDLLQALVSPTLTGDTKLTLRPLSITIDGISYTYFKGGWFDLSNFSFDFGNLKYSGTEHASTIYQWIRTINSVIITLLFIPLVFRMIQSFFGGLRFSSLSNTSDSDITEDSETHIVDDTGVVRQSYLRHKRRRVTTRRK